MEKKEMLETKWGHIINHAKKQLIYYKNKELTINVILKFINIQEYLRLYEMGDRSMALYKSLENLYKID